MAVVETKDVFLEGCAFYKKGRYEEALQNFSSIWESNPEHIDNLSMLSSVLIKLGRFEEALSVCEEALTLKKDDVTLLNNKGYIQSFVGENQKAIENSLKKLNVQRVEFAYQNTGAKIFNIMDL